MAEEFRVLQDELLQDIEQAGVLTREELQAGGLQAIADLTGGGDLASIREAGERARRQQQFISGTLTPEEQAAFRTEFGIEEEGVSPEQQLAEESLLRRQRATGISRGGLGFEQFGRLGLEEAARRRDIEARQFQQATQIAQQAQAAGTGVANLRTRLAENLARQRQNELAQQSLLRQQTLQGITQLGRRAGETGAQAQQQAAALSGQATQGIFRGIGGGLTALGTAFGGTGTQATQPVQTTPTATISPALTPQRSPLNVDLGVQSSTFSPLFGTRQLGLT
jgi:hypothetical protein